MAASAKRVSASVVAVRSHTPPTSASATSSADSALARRSARISSRFVVVAARMKRGDQRLQRSFGRRAEQASEAAGILRDQPPQIGRMIGEAEQEIAHVSSREKRARVRRFGLAEQRLEAPARVGGRGEPRRRRAGGRRG